MSSWQGTQATIFEVGPRDGLQNEKRSVNLDDKSFLVNGLVSAGLRDIELGAFVRQDRVPQMAEIEELLARLDINHLFGSGVRPWFLVPNRTGLKRAIACKVRHIAVFVATTDSFTKNNIGKTVSEAFDEVALVVAEARVAGISVRGYISTVFGCPFEGKVSPATALKTIERLMALGVEQVSLGDTIGVATPRGVDEVVQPALETFGDRKIAVHFHDTRGTALANTLRSMEHGVRVFDASAGGLGGCPFAPGATGNLATEDLVYMLEGMGLSTGVDLDRLCQLSADFGARIGRPLSSRCVQAWQSARKKGKS